MTAYLTNGDGKEFPLRFGWFEALCDLAMEYDQDHNFSAFIVFDDDTCLRFYDAVKKAMKQSPEWFADNYTREMTSLQKAEKLLDFLSVGNLKGITF